MKPTFPINHADVSHDGFAGGRKGAAAPKIEFFFQTPSPEFRGHRPGDSASFRSISEDYFAREARADFKSEALVFGLIALTAAIPIFEGIRGLAHFVYGVL
ncbi:MAG: hypothetical protein ABI992_05185 [Chthoniobacterales bacterium]